MDLWLSVSGALIAIASVGTGAVAIIAARQDRSRKKPSGRRSSSVSGQPLGSWRGTSTVIAILSAILTAVAAIISSLLP
jgi:hypothetical protein